MSKIKTWNERCEEHPDHQTGMVSNSMIQARMQEEIDELRAALAEPVHPAIPLENSREAADAIEATLAEYGHPTNPVNAARAGWRAARLYTAPPQRPAEPVLQTCNCRWDGETQVQQCTLHEAHVDAIHEWAERAKVAEKKLAALAEPQEPDSPERRCGGPGCDMRCCQPVQEPIGYLWPTGRHPEFRFTQQKRDGIDGTPVYTSPPQRKPVEWDGRCMLGHCNSPAGCENSGECRAIERAHKIGGEG